MSQPTPAKRRQFEPHQRAGGGGGGSSHKKRPGEDEADESEEEEAGGGTIIRTIETSNGRTTMADDLSSVNAKIGLFERLSSADEALLLRRQQRDFRYHTDLNDEEEEEEELYDCSSGHDQLDEEEEDFLVLDTIVEEDDELLTETEDADDADKQTDCDLPGGRFASANREHDKRQPVNCDDASFSHKPLLVRQSAATCASNDPSTQQSNADAATSQDKNNNRDSPRTEATIGQVSRQPPGECHDDEKENNNNKFGSQEQQAAAVESVVRVELYGQSSNGADKQQQQVMPTESENILLADESRATTRKQLQQAASSHETSSQTQQVASAPADLKLNQNQLSASNKMQYQPLLPSTNRLISEHQARQQQALFRALNARQKLLDELGPDERSRQADLMSASSLHLHKSHRQWRRSAKHDTNSNKQRRRSSSMTTRDSAERAATRGVPLSAVDLSSMTDQQVDELLGQLAPASSSSSLASSSSGGGTHNLLNGARRDPLSSGRSSSSESAADSDLTSTSASSSSDDLEDDNGQHMLPRRMRRQRCFSSSTSDSYNNNNNNNNQSNRQQVIRRHPVVAPSVVGVHEDGAPGGELQSPGQLASKASLKSQTRKCREAYKRQRGGRNGDRSDDDDDQDQDGRDRRNPGDLSVNVGAGSGSGAGSEQPASGVATTMTTSGQCSLSPQAHNVSFSGLSSSSTGGVSSGAGGGSGSGSGAPTSQSPTTSDEPSAPESMGSLLAPSAGGTATGSGVEAILSRMLGALDEASAQEEQEQLNDLLERGFLHLEQLLNCSLTPANQQQQQQVVAASGGVGGGGPTSSQARSQTHHHHQQLISASSASQKDSDYGSDTQSTGECFSTATSSSTSGPAAVATQEATSSKTSTLSPLAIELSFKLAESLRQLAAQQQQQQQQQVKSAPQTVAVQPEAAPAPTSGAPARARMKSVVMINSPPATGACSPASSRPHSSRSETIGGNTTPQPLADSRPGSQQSLHRPREFRTRISVNTPTRTASAGLGAEDEATASRGQGQAQIVRVVASSPVAQHAERPSRRSSFRNSSLRRRPSFTGSIGSSREPGGPRPGSPVPRSVLEQQQQQHQVSSSVQVNQGSPAMPAVIKFASCPGNSGQQQQAAQQDASSSKQQRQLQKALVLAQKYNYSPAKLAASKLSCKLQLKELVGDSSLAAVQTMKTKSLNGGDHDDNDDSKQVAGGTQQCSLREINGQLAPTFAVTGKVQLDISYFAKSGSLTVHLLQCAQLAAVSKRRTTSNPYVKLYLLPDRTKTGKRKSSVKRHQLEPKFDERFTFGPLQLADFDSRILWLSVWHKDRGLSRNEFLGEIFLPMSKVRHQLLTSDLSCQSTAAKWYELTDRSDRLESLDSMRRQPKSCTNNNSNNNLLTTKRPPRESGSLSMSLARPSGVGNYTTTTQTAVPSVQQQQAAEMVAKKLSEFERKAARLTQQSQLALGTPSSGGGYASQEHESRLLKTLDRSHKGALQLPATEGGQQQQHQPPKAMQVTLGPLSEPPTSNGSSGLVTPITGQLFVALKFVPETGELLARRASASLEGNLHVLVKEARNIGGFNSAKISNQQQLPSPFCKCYLLDSSGQRLAKQRTSQLKRTISPQWDQELVFGQLKLAHLQAQAIEIQLFNRDSILVSSSEHLGAIRLCKRLKGTGGGGGGGETASAATGSEESTTSADQSASLRSSVSSKSSGSQATSTHADEDICSERESRLWSQMLTRPNIWVYGELPLRQLRPLVALSGNNHLQ